MYSLVGLQEWAKLNYLTFILLLFLGCTTTSTPTPNHNIRLDEPHFVLVTDRFYSRELDFDSLPNEQMIYLTYWGASPTAEFKFGDKSLFIDYQGKETEKVYLQFKNKTKTISFKIQGAPALYEHSYIQQHSGKVTAEIPEVYELTNIVLALADKFYQSNDGNYSRDDYHHRMMKWFAPFKDHALFSELNHVDYYSFVENGPAYVFDNDQILRSDTYAGFRAQDAIAGNVTLLEDFAKVSHFRAFFQQQQPYYVSLTQQFQRDVQPQKIWQWLKSQFPGRYQSYKVFFSPLGVGRHSARMYENNDFKEAVMFISGPNRYKKESDSTSVRAIKLSRSFFTEIDHAYVNPVSDKYIENINLALPDLSSWYKGGGYNKPYSTFNEYMTWSVFLLYAMDTYSADEYAMIKIYVENFMVNKRGFFKFKAFNQELTRLFENRSKNQTIEDLYEPILDWLKIN